MAPPGTKEKQMQSNEFDLQRLQTRQDTETSAVYRRSSAGVPFVHTKAKLQSKYQRGPHRNSLGADLSRNLKVGKVKALDNAHRYRFNLLPELFKTSQTSGFKGNSIFKDIESTNFDSDSQSKVHIV